MPFDFIRTFWKDYFEGRYIREHLSPNYWLNIYAPEDVLGSNFRNNNDPGPAELSLNNKESRPPTSGTAELNPTTPPETAQNAGNTQSGTSQRESPAAPRPVNLIWVLRIGKRDLSVVDILTFGGLRSHSMYWDKAQEPQMNCFDAFAANVFTKERLSPQAEPSSSD